MAITKILYLVRETKNTVRYEEKTSRDNERPHVEYIQKRFFPSGDYPDTVQVRIEW